MANVVSLKNRYLLSDCDDYSAINVPLKTTGRIKYTCFDVSQSFLVFGATSGGLYVFKREPCTFIQLLPNKEGPVTSVLISPDEKLFAFASQRGIVCVLERTEGVSARLLNRSTEHSGTNVTALQWANTSDQIFIGDSIGRLSVINVSLFMSKNIFQIPAFIFMQLDSSVVQISSYDDRLLISTLTHCYVCDTAKEQYRQIGTKPRDGEYGACYLNNKIFCARPGSRLWEVDLEGTVQSTHQFKGLLSNTKPVLVITDNVLFNNVEHRSTPDQQSFNFIKLLPILKFLFTFKNNGIYIFDPDKVDVVLWSNHFKDIIDAKCLDDRIYIWTESKKLHALNIVLVDKCLLRLYFREKYDVCLELLKYFSKELLSLTSSKDDESKEFLCKLNSLIDLNKYVDLNDDDIIKLLKEIETLSSSQIKEKATRLESGIFKLDNHHNKCQKLILENNKKSQNNYVNNVTNTENKVVPLQNNCGNSSSSNSDYDKLSDGISSSGCESSIFSLPEIIRSSDNFNSDTSNEERNNSSNITNGVYNVTQLPFLPLSSPDLIHDALLEIGYNVSDKLVTSTKTLKDKWQVLEGKLKLSTKIVDNNYVPFDFKSPTHTDNQTNKEIVNGDVMEKGSLKFNGHNDFNDDDEPLVVSKTTNSSCCVNKKKTLNNLKFNASELINICSELDKLNNREKCLANLNDLLLVVLNSFKQYNDFIAQSSSLSSKECIKYFPFNQFLTENYVVLIKNMLHDGLITSELIKWVNINRNNVIFDNIIKIRKEHPYVLKNAYSDDLLHVDYLLSELLTVFSELLDPYTILQDLNSTDLQCTYLSWCAIMDRFQDGALRYFTRNNYDKDLVGDEKNISQDKSNNENLNIGCKDWPMPLLLNAMFLLFRLDQVEPVIKMGEEGDIPVSMVSYILLKLSSHLYETNSSSNVATKKFDIDYKCANLFLIYLSKVYKKIYIDYDNIGLLWHIEECFIIINKDLNYCLCQCGFPKTNVNNRLSSSSPVQKHVNHNIKYPNIAELLINYFWDSRIKPDLLTNMPSKNGLNDDEDNDDQNDENFWSLLGNLDSTIKKNTNDDFLEHIKRICSVAPPLLLWLLRNKIKHDLFTVRSVLILQLGYLNEFDVNNIHGLDKWEQIVTLNSRIERGECCFCNRKYEPIPGVNWSQLSVMILKTIGPSATLHIFKKYVGDLPHGAINKKFYQACMLSCYVESRLSKNDTHKKEKIISTINLVTNDSSSVSSTAVVSSNCQAGIELAQAISLDVITEPDHLSARLIDNENHHWGTSIDLETGCCCLCSLSLAAPCLLQDTGLRTFTCGHSFHFVCLNVKNSLKSCPICFR